MAGFYFRLEFEDGTPADPPTPHTAVPNWAHGDTIPRRKNALDGPQEGAAMTWARTHWIAIATAAVLFLVGLGLGIGSAGADGKSAPKTTVVVTQNVVTETLVDGNTLLANQGPGKAKP